MTDDRRQKCFTSFRLQASSFKLILSKRKEKHLNQISYLINKIDNHE